MKRMTLGLLLAAAGFAAGQATKPALKFPYASRKLNEPCNRTELEWRCAVREIRCEPIELQRHFDIVDLRLEPRADSLLIRVRLDWKPGLPQAIRKTAKPEERLRDVSIFVFRKLNEWGFSPDPNWVGMDMRIYFRDKLIARRTVEGLRIGSG